MTKNFYPLIGHQVSSEPWVVKLKARPDLLFAYHEIDFISASPCPLLYWEQLPLDWKNNHPGFNIFLRSRVDETLPHWILNPMTDKSQRGTRYTFIKNGRSSKKFKTVLILQHHNQVNISWSDLQAKFPDADIRWISYASSHLPEWPLDSRIDFRMFCYIQDWLPEALYDLNYGQGDTISPIHLHALHQGAYLINEPPETKDLIPKDSINRWYGQWKIFDSTP